MSNDPFARFESSRGGWLIPILLFVIGALGTMVGIRAIHGLEVPSTQQESTQDDLPQSESATSEPSGTDAPDASNAPAASDASNATSLDAESPDLNSTDRQ